MSPLLLAATPPAGGAAIDQIVIATVGATVLTALLLWLCTGHRSGSVAVLGRLAGWAGRTSGLPGWAALPVSVGGTALLVAVFGMYWDISLHIDNGRDEGPLANPAHYFILAGLFGIFSAGVLAIFLPGGERPGPAAVRLTRDWHAPVGGVLIAACGAFALIGFPLDDVWHRIFGQDVTLWGPTHLMLIGGAGLTLVGLAVLVAEGVSARGPAPQRRGPRPRGVGSLVAIGSTARRVGLMGGLLIGLSTFQAEFDFGVPQYRFVFEPLLVALAAGFALTAARLWIGRGGALAAVAFFVLIRGGLALLVGPVLGQSTPMLPLYLGSAIVVELAAVWLARRPLAFAAVSGVLVGTVGFATEWAWSQVAMPLPWTADLLPEGLVLAVVAGTAGAVVGALLALGLRGELPRAGVARPALALSGLALAGCLASGLVTTTPPVTTTATVAISDVRGEGAQRTAQAEVRFDPAGFADEAGWVTVTAWQGGGLRVDPLERVEPGVWRTTAPVPVGGTWKSLVRVQDGRQVVGAPIFLPADEAIGAPEVPAAASFTRPLVRDTEILQRELTGDVPGWLWVGASSLVALLFLGFFAALAWGVGRLARRTASAEPAPRPPSALPAGATRRRPVPRPAATGAPSR